ncbi:hypothetical protein NA57DRAFT_50544 [Rhizodiscina lignyota]|uniref:Uncharacterized protein n=1 Tax=Rhizodiscina lignyota TaxID=1504668 RepID=A0A9P4IPL1_9PEZI|nr:hypothetical protein NA57DRAFT_50544 [Rhizodiscina lignyota]
MAAPGYTPQGLRPGVECPVDPGNLPPNTKQITYFGERAAFSPDGKKIAFMDKSYGDAFELDLETNRITLLTHPQNAGFLRVQYLPNGDYVLIGSRSFVDITTTRDTTQELWVLKQGEINPIPLNHFIDEGVAISRKSAKIAWAINHDNYPGVLIEGETLIYTADVVYAKNGTPYLDNQKEVIRAWSPDCVLEPQDFRNDDNELIFICYRQITAEISLANMRGIDLNTGKISVYRNVTNEYNEVEGIYPDGQYELVESSKGQIHPHGDDAIDIWKLKIEPHGTNFRRVTCFGSNVNGKSPINKASNPVVSPNGHTIAFQAAIAGDPAGVGYGLFLLDRSETS